MNIRQIALSAAIFAVLAGQSGCAQTVASPPPVSSVSESLSEAEAPELKESEQPYRSVTRHALLANGQNVSYTAIAGETFLRDAVGNATASIFSFSYIRDDIEDEHRPVIFVFNGGPGSASIWIHMGAIGPRRLVLDADVNPSNVPPFGLEDNPHSVLDVADLVFIDPVGTGYSRPLNGTDPKTFWGVDEDAEAVAQFIELWLTEHGRWNSPKYVMGESYGSIRAAVLPRALMGGPIYSGVMRGITLNGIILLGTTLEGRQQQGAPEGGDDLAARQARVLPGLAVTAAFHNPEIAGGRTAAEIYEESSRFARSVYEPALRQHQAGNLPESERSALLAELSRLTGLSPADFGEGLHIDERSFAKRSLRGQGLEVGMYDSRYTLPLANSGGDPVADDPAMTLYVPGFIASFNQMLRNDLKVETGRPYAAIMWKDLLFGWNWERRGVADGQSFATDIAWSMRRTPSLRLLVASGYYDLVTTPADARASIEAANIPKDRVTFTDYESGHMLYLGGTSEAFSNDLRAFLEAGRR